MSNKKRNKFCHVAPRVDNKPPRFNASAYMKASNLYKDAKRIKEIDKENMRLLQKMNTIHRLGVSIIILLKASTILSIIMYYVIIYFVM